MADLFWPGDERAGALASQAAYLEALVRVEQAWLGQLVSTAVAPPEAAAGLSDLPTLVGESDLPGLARRAEGIGNPVSALVALLRERLPAPAARWLHRGLTSQDVVDTALMVCARDAAEAIRADLRRQGDTAAALADRHRATVMTGRTLTQPAVPTTFGLRAATWLNGLVAADTRLGAVVFPAQCGGAAGTLAATVELARLRGLPDPVGTARAAARGFAGALGLAAADPWHTERSVVTGLGDALVTCADVWGRIAGDVLVLSRPEIGEVHEGAGGGSSTMPHKHNPVLATMISRSALAATHLGATLHSAAAAYTDERPAGAWHAEWEALAALLRRGAAAAAQTSELLAGLVVDAERMRANAQARGAELRAEQRSLASLVAAAGRAADPDYLGAAGPLVDAALARAAAHWSHRP